MQLSDHRIKNESPESKSGAFFTPNISPPTFSGTISLNHCCFSLSAFHDSLFKEHNVYFPAELDRAFLKRKAEFFAGRYCAKHSLLALDGTIADVHIGPQRCPIWPAHVVGSISHSGNQAIAVTALKQNFRGLGIDIQYEIDAKTYTAIKNQILFGNEHEVIFSGSELDIRVLFTIAFSAKESFFKAAFAEVGWYFDFSAVSIKSIDQEGKIIHMCINETLSKKLVVGTEFQAEFKHTHDNKIITLVRLY